MIRGRAGSGEERRFTITGGPPSPSRSFGSIVAATDTGSVVAPICGRPQPDTVCDGRPAEAAPAQIEMTSTTAQRIEARRT